MIYRRRPHYSAATSNWTKDRIEKAISIAHNLNLTMQTQNVESSQFSLAVPEKELWHNAKSVGKGIVDNNIMHGRYMLSQDKNSIFTSPGHRRKRDF